MQLGRSGSQSSFYFSLGSNDSIVDCTAYRLMTIFSLFIFIYAFLCSGQRCVNNKIVSNHADQSNDVYTKHLMNSGIAKLPNSNIKGNCRTWNRNRRDLFIVNWIV